MSLQGCNGGTSIKVTNPSSEEHLAAFMEGTAPGGGVSSGAAPQRGGQREQRSAGGVEARTSDWTEESAGRIHLKGE